MVVGTDASSLVVNPSPPSAVVLIGTQPCCLLMDCPELVCLAPGPRSTSTPCCSPSHFFQPAGPFPASARSGSSQTNALRPSPSRTGRDHTTAAPNSVLAGGPYRQAPASKRVSGRTAPPWFCGMSTPRPAVMLMATIQPVTFHPVRSGVAAVLASPLSDVNGDHPTGP